MGARAANEVDPKKEHPMFYVVTYWSGVPGSVVSRHRSVEAAYKAMDARDAKVRRQNSGAMTPYSVVNDADEHVGRDGLTLREAYGV